MVQEIAKTTAELHKIFVGFKLDQSEIFGFLTSGHESSYSIELFSFLIKPYKSWHILRKMKGEKKFMDYIAE